MTSSDDNYEDVRASNDDSECEDETKRQDKACGPMGDDEGDLIVSNEDVRQLLVMAEVLRRDIPDLKARVQRLERVQWLSLAMWALAVFG